MSMLRCLHVYFQKKEVLSLSFIAAFHAGNITLFLDLNIMSGPRKKTEGKQQQHLSMASGVSVTVKLKHLNFSRCQFKAHIIAVLQHFFLISKPHVLIAEALENARIQVSVPSLGPFTDQ